MRLNFPDLFNNAYYTPEDRLLEEYEALKIVLPSGLALDGIKWPSRIPLAHCLSDNSPGRSENNGINNRRKVLPRPGEYVCSIIRNNAASFPIQNARYRRSFPCSVEKSLIQTRCATLQRLQHFRELLINK